MPELKIKKIFFLLFCTLALSATHLKAQESEVVPNLELNKLLRLTVKSSINPATLHYITSGLKRAQAEKHDGLLIEINTPGGLVSTTKDIITAIGEASIPTIIWVTPEGASATSAGALIASSAHLLFMSEGTNIGAATPIQMSGEVPEDLRNKAINDLVALVQSLSEARGRNGKLFGEMVSKASSFQSSEALKENLINGIANDEEHLLAQISTMSLHLKGQTYNVVANNVAISNHEMSTGNALLNILADPNLAYILLLLGAALIYLEFQAPGGFIAGSLGAVLLLISGISFQVLPLNFGALGLLVLAFILFVLEVYITSYGVLSLLGLAALITGSLFLYETDNSYLALAPEVIAAAIMAIGVFLFLILYFLLRDYKKSKDHHFNEALGKEALILEIVQGPKDEGHYYQIKVEGEIWRARSNTLYRPGSYVKVVSLDHNSLTYILS